MGFRAEPAIACAIPYGWLKRLNSLKKFVEPNPPTLGSTKEVDAWLTVSGKVGTNAEGVPQLAYKALKSAWQQQ